MDESRQVETEGNYPPYNISRTGDEAYRISLAIAGFKPENITVTAHQNTLTIAGRVDERQDGTEYLYRGIAGRAFERKFNLADFVGVRGAAFEDGLLEIDLERRVPETMKPRRVEIRTGNGPSRGDNVKNIERAKTG